MGLLGPEVQILSARPKIHACIDQMFYTGIWSDFATPKWCGGCSRESSLDCFGLKYPARGVRQHLCRECQRQASKRYYQRDRAKYIARAGDVTFIANASGKAMLAAEITKCR